MNDNQSYKGNGSNGRRDAQPNTQVETAVAQSIAAKVIGTVRTSELVYQDTERDRRLKIRKVLNQAIDRSSLL